MELQQILGVDKRNPCFTICRNTNDGTLHFYYGAEILEKLPDVRDHPQYKLMVARLYNAGVNATKLPQLQLFWSENHEFRGGDLYFTLYLQGCDF